jgi:uracil-DNA glycosylase family 4
MKLDVLNAEIVGCRRCPRLVEWREQVGREKRKSYQDDIYWAKPVPIFGDPDAERLIVGLAPAAHGANRTGRMFHGDRSGDWLFRALHKAGVAKLAKADSIAGGQELYGAMITASAHCAPPDNKPLPSELDNCSGYLRSVIESRKWKSILCLGGVAWKQVHRLLGVRAPPFTHGVYHWLDNGTLMVASFHPSQQNTFTGRLTEEMLDAAIGRWLERS